MKKPRDRLRVREVVCERVVVRSPRGGRVRAVLEAVPTRPGRAAKVRLVLFAPDGEIAFQVEVGPTGEPNVAVGHPDRGTTVRISRRAVDAWHAGNIVAALRSTDEGGVVETFDERGRARRIR